MPPQAAFFPASAATQAVSVFQQVFQGGVFGNGLGLRNVVGQIVEQGGNVGGALYVGMPAQGDNTAARAPHVAEQQLDDARSPDDLHAAGVLCPAQGIGHD